MFRIDAKFIRHFLLQSGMTIREFATRAGLNELTARKLTRDGATATLKTVAVVAKFFGVDGNQIILSQS